MSSEKRLKAYYIFLDISKTPISIPKNLHDTVPRSIDKITEKQLPWISFIFPPILLAVGAKNYELVDRKWCYQLQVERNINQILFLVFEDRSDQDHHNVKIQPVLNPLIDGFVSSIAKMTSKATIARRKATLSKRQCPFCHDALMKPRGIWMPDENGFFRAHCFNAKQGRCDCYLLLTASEKESFLSYKFDIQKHVRELPGKICPKCGKQLYLRIVHAENGNTTHYETCRNYRMSSKHSCSHKAKIIGDAK